MPLLSDYPQKQYHGWRMILKRKRVIGWACGQWFNVNPTDLVGLITHVRWCNQHGGVAPLTRAQMVARRLTNAAIN